MNTVFIFDFCNLVALAPLFDNATDDGRGDGGKIKNIFISIFSL